MDCNKIDGFEFYILSCLLSTFALSPKEMLNEHKSGLLLGKREKGSTQLRFQIIGSLAIEG